MGSVHHVTALCTDPCDLTVLAQTNIIPSNFILIDRVKKNNACYFFPTAGVTFHEGDDRFQGYYDFIDPVGVAEGLLNTASVQQ